MQIKCKLIPTLIMTGISLLLGYAFYSANSSEWQKWLMFALATIEFSVFFIGGFGIHYAEKGDGNISVVSVIFAIAAVICQLIATFTKFHTASYIVVNGIIVLIYFGIIYALAKALNS